MIERVARAMKERATQPLANIPTLEPVLVGSLGDAWLYLAKAAIAAMREPTEAMLGAATRLAPTWDDDVSRAKWQAMIDEALK